MTANALASGDQLSRLTGLDAGPHRVVSCYLKLEPRDRARGKYQIKIKNRMKQARDGLDRLGLGKAEQDEVERDLGRVESYLRAAANLPPARGIAIFACEALDLFEAVPLPFVHRSRLLVDRTALVRELAGIEDEFGRLLVAVVDRTSARLFEVTAFTGRELPGIHSTSTRGGRFRGDQNAPGWGEHTYHNRMREEKHRHYDQVARALFEQDRAQPARGIVLAGTGVDARALESFLHPYLAERLLGRTTINPKTAALSEVRQAALAVREEHERQREEALAAEVREREGAGWAVNGINRSLRALGRGQARLLLVDPDTAVPGFRCGDTGQLSLTAAGCRGQGQPQPVLDVVDDAIEEALRQGVDVNVLYGEDAAQSVDGMAALLRFR